MEQIDHDSWHLIHDACFDLNIALLRSLLAKGDCAVSIYTDGECLFNAARHGYSDAVKKYLRDPRSEVQGLMLMRNEYREIRELLHAAGAKETENENVIRRSADRWPWSGQETN